MAADDITVELVRRLVAEQFPQWVDLPVRPVDRQGWDNRSFRLGDELTVRLPSGDGYVAGLVREESTLATLGPRVDVTLPRVVATGRPTRDFPRPWSVREWIDGTTLTDLSPALRPTAMGAVGRGLAALHRADTAGGPWPGSSSAYRGCHPSVWAEETQRELQALPDEAQRKRLASLWQRGCATVWTGSPRWVHGDLAPGNLLFGEDGELAAVIDVGQTCVGDPACDLSFGWLACTPSEHAAFAAALDVDDDAWLRGAAWALWKTLISSDASLADRGCRTREEILSELCTRP